MTDGAVRVLVLVTTDPGGGAVEELLCTDVFHGLRVVGMRNPLGWVDARLVPDGYAADAVLGWAGGKWLIRELVVDAGLPGVDVSRWAVDAFERAVPLRG